MDNLYLFAFVRQLKDLSILCSDFLIEGFAL
jgi:hypothetical protein